MVRPSKFRQLEFEWDEYSLAELVGHSLGFWEAEECFHDFHRVFRNKRKSGRSYETFKLEGVTDSGRVVDWQLYHRVIDDFIAPDVDTNHDGYVSREEAAKWPEFHWNWQPGQGRVSYQEIEAALRQDPGSESLYRKAKTSALYQDGIFNRGPIHRLTASLRQDVYVYTGALDEQTSPREALELQRTCHALGKENCYVTIVPGVGHGFSPPKAPRRHPLLDMTIGPVEPAFQEVLFQLGRKLVRFEQ